MKWQNNRPVHNAHFLFSKGYLGEKSAHIAKFNDTSYFSGNVSQFLKNYNNKNMAIKFS